MTSKTGCRPNSEDNSHSSPSSCLGHPAPKGWIPCVTCPDGLLQAVVPLSLEKSVVIAGVPLHPGLGSTHPHPDAGPVLQWDAFPDVALHWNREEGQLQKDRANGTNFNAFSSPVLSLNQTLRCKACPGPVAQLVGASSCTPKGFGFNPQLGRVREATD